jgi:catechol 2,3-dioxygenase-like lactoylglutathione lyase family enzyme
MSDAFSGFGSVIHRVRDLSRSAEWYERVLGLTPFHRSETDKGNTIAVFAIGSTMLTLWQISPDQELRTGALGGTYITLTSDDVEASRRVLEERGGDPESIVDYHPFRLFWLFDPDGNRIEIAQVLAES